MLCLLPGCFQYFSRLLSWLSLTIDVVKLGIEFTILLWSGVRC